MTRVHNFGAMAHQHALNQMQTQEGQAVPQDHKIYVQRRHHYNYLVGKHQLATVATVALVALSVILSLKIIVLAAAAFYVRHSIEQHINANPVLPGLNLPSHHFHPNNSHRSAQLRLFLGLPNTLPPAPVANPAVNNQAAGNVANNQAANNQPANNQAAGEQVVNNQAAANQPANNQAAAAPAELWEPDAYGFEGFSLWKNKAPMTNVVPAASPYVEGFDVQTAFGNFMRMVNEIHPPQRRQELAQGARDDYGFNPFQGNAPREEDAPARLQNNPANDDGDALADSTLNLSGSPARPLYPSSSSRFAPSFTSSANPNPFASRTFYPSMSSNSSSSSSMMQSSSSNQFGSAYDGWDQSSSFPSFAAQSSAT